MDGAHCPSWKHNFAPTLLVSIASTSMNGFYPFSRGKYRRGRAAVWPNRIPEGVVRANERMTDDLILGIALPQTIGATAREWPFKFIDCDDWRANTFQVTSEYTMSEAGGPTIRVDLVLFVNGIPLGVIEVKASHVSSDQGVSQQIRNQKAGEGVPSIFYSTQLLLAANSHDPRYGTVGTPRKLWSVWKESARIRRTLFRRGHRQSPFRHG